MTNVYVVLYWDYDDTEVYKVYKNRSDAVAYEKWTEEEGPKYTKIVKQYYNDNIGKPSNEEHFNACLLNNSDVLDINGNLKEYLSKIQHIGRIYIEEVEIV